mmetsp:Transcript_5756/g.14722  ORF Transcript_5756/g.14722 Transcript_5756/m.14722 type:complete len:264 (+) Transcript_5756:382-1173(+)
MPVVDVDLAGHARTRVRLPRHEHAQLRRPRAHRRRPLHHSCTGQDLDDGALWQGADGQGAARAQVARADSRRPRRHAHHQPARPRPCRQRELQVVRVLCGNRRGPTRDHTLGRHQRLLREGPQGYDDAPHGVGPQHPAGGLVGPHICAHLPLRDSRRVDLQRLWPPHHPRLLPGCPRGDPGRPLRAVHGRGHEVPCHVRLHRAHHGAGCRLARGQDRLRHCRGLHHRHHLHCQLHGRGGGHGSQGQPGGAATQANGPGSRCGR